MSGAPALVGWHHVQVAIPPGGEQQARAFYSDLLGLAEIDKPAHLRARGGCWFRTPFGAPPIAGGRQAGAGLELHLGVDADFHPARKAHVAFGVQGLPAMRARLQDAGVAIMDDAPLEGLPRFYVHDPFGNRLELIDAPRDLSSSPPS